MGEGRGEVEGTDERGEVGVGVGDGMGKGRGNGGGRTDGGR